MRKELSDAVNSGQSAFMKGVYSLAKGFSTLFSFGRSSSYSVPSSLSDYQAQSKETDANARDSDAAAIASDFSSIGHDFRDALSGRTTIDTYDADEIMQRYRCICR